jgi:hypothetical protein
MSLTQVQNMNQFTQTPMVGSVDLTVFPNIKAVRINPAYVGGLPLVAGQVFKLVDVAGEIPVVEPAAVTEKGYGVAVHTLKRDTFLAGDVIDVACQGSVVFLESSAAIAGAAKVQNTPSGPNVQTLASLATNCQIGVNITKSAAAGIVRIELDFQDPNLSAY